MSTASMVLAAAAGGAMTAVPSTVLGYLGIRRLRTAYRFTCEKLELAEYDATHDCLTGLVNRRAFYEHAARLVASVDRDRPLAVVMVDLDDFKTVNDTHGHGVGDLVLVAVADRLRDRLPEALVARLHGDEFAVIVPMRRGESPQDIGDALVDASDSPIVVPTNLPADACLDDDVVRDVTLSMTWSAGVAPVWDSSALTEVLGRADAALYEAKRSDSTGVAVHESVVYEYRADVPQQRPTVRTRGSGYVDRPVASHPLMTPGQRWRTRRGRW